MPSDEFRKLCERVGGSFEEDPVTGVARCRISKPIELVVRDSSVRVYLHEEDEDVEFSTLVYRGSLPYVAIEIENKDVKVLRMGTGQRVGIELPPGSVIEYRGGGYIVIR